jgi:glutaredoxin
MPEVTIYTTPTCAWCAAVKRFLDEHEIEYTESGTTSLKTRMPQKD